jgi:hypothetical protein
MKGQPISPELKRRMALGREAARQKRVMAKERAQEQTRGRPASVVGERPLPPEQPKSVPTFDRSPELAALEAAVENYDAATVTRETRVSGTEFDIPMRGRRTGWDYCWWPTHIMGQEIDPSSTVEIQHGGWIPVPASHFPGQVPRGWARPTIDRQGQRMYMRPMRLTEEALAEQKKLAYEQKASRLAAAQAGDAGREFARRVNADGTPAAQIDVSVRPLL